MKYSLSSFKTGILQPRIGLIEINELFSQGFNYRSVPQSCKNGVNVMAKDWDNLIILDACRPDALDSARETHPWLPKGSTRWSVGGTSSQWMNQTFGDPDINLSDIGYITGNPYSRD